MHFKRFVLAFLAVFGFLFFYDWIYHGLLLKGLYSQTPQLWRLELEIQQRAYLVALGQALFSLVFCYIFTKGHENRGIPEGLRYGFWIGLLLLPMNLIFYAIQPLPRALIVAWCIGGTLQMILAGGILAAIYRQPPAARATGSA